MPTLAYMPVPRNSERNRASRRGRGQNETWKQSNMSGCGCNRTRRGDIVSMTPGNRTPGRLD
eukprot:59303-Alexandrium_andersonii.AAC.1